MILTINSAACDRCKCEINSSNSKFITTLSSKSSSLENILYANGMVGEYYINRIGQNDESHLCGACLDLFYRFMKND